MIESDEPWRRGESPLSRYDEDEEEIYEDDDEETSTVSCRACGAEVYEDALECPVCNQYLEAGSRSPLAGRPLWYVALAILGMGALIFALVVS